MIAALSPAHLLFFDKTLTDKLINSGLDKSGGDDFAKKGAFAIIGNARLIIRDI